MSSQSADPLWPLIERALTAYRSLAVVGLSDRPHRASHQVSQYMRRAGYDITPVNPEVEEVFGLPSHASLLEVPGKLEIVNVFRRSEYVPEVVRQAIRRQAKVLWLQIGVVHEPAAAEARRAGLEVIMDRCIMVEHRQLHAAGSSG